MKIFFLLFCLFIFSINFIVAEECDSPGEFNLTNYCNVEGVLDNLKNDNAFCLNSYECFNQSCIEGVCQSKYGAIFQQGDLINTLLALVTGTECNPGEEKCEGRVYFMCGVGSAWEEKGEIEGHCGISISSSGGSSSCRPNWECTNWSEYDFKSNTFCGSRICIDKKHCNRQTGKPITFISCSKSISANFYCGDNICNTGETPYSCEEDCKVISLNSECGNLLCEDNESSFTCSEDCEAKSLKNASSIFWIVVIIILIILFFLVFALYKKIKKNNIQESNAQKVFK